MSSLPDWRDSKAYEALRNADRSALAWEWLRRDPGYCESFRDYSQQSPTEAAAELARWGLHAWVAPALGARDARPVWRAERHPQALQARARASAVDAGSFDLARLAPLATLIGDGQNSHLLMTEPPPLPSPGCRRTYPHRRAGAPSLCLERLLEPRPTVVDAFSVAPAGEDRRNR